MVAAFVSTGDCPRPLDPSLVLRRTRKAASAVLSLGRTQILAEVVGELVQPFLDKPSEGMLTFSVNYKVVLAEEGRVDNGGSSSAQQSPAAAELCRRGARRPRLPGARHRGRVISGERVW